MKWNAKCRRENNNNINNGIELLQTNSLSCVSVRIVAFYLSFYIVLAIFFALYFWLFMKTISYDGPKYYLDDSVIGTSPGMSSSAPSVFQRGTFNVQSDARKV